LSSAARREVKNSRKGSSIRGTNRTGRFFMAALQRDGKQKAEKRNGVKTVPEDVLVCCDEEL